MNDLSKPKHRRWAHGAFRSLLLLLLSSVAVLWAWNAIAVELFHGPAIQFKHVLAVQTALVALAAALLSAGRRSPRSANTPPER